MNEIGEEKQRFRLEGARNLARKIVEQMRPHCERIEIAGSIRREKELVGDIEVLYIPKIVNGIDTDDLFRRQKTVNATDLLLDEWVRCEKITKRLKGDGTCTWGDEIKLGRTVASGMPVDFFTANRANWWNLLVCRTGSASSNMRIATGALKIGWKWRPYSVGFSKLDEATGREQWHKVHSEEDAFYFVGLPCPVPQRRT